MGCVASGGLGSVRGSPCGEPARLRFTSLRPPSYGDYAAVFVKRKTSTGAVR